MFELFELENMFEIAAVNAVDVVDVVTVPDDAKAALTELRMLPSETPEKKDI